MDGWTIKVQAEEQDIERGWRQHLLKELLEAALQADAKTSTPGGDVPMFQLVFALSEYYRQIEEDAEGCFASGGFNGASSAEEIRTEAHGCRRQLEEAAEYLQANPLWPLGAN